MKKTKSNFFRKREPSNSNPIAQKLAFGQFKPRLIKDKKKQAALDRANNVPGGDDGW